MRKRVLVLFLSVFFLFAFINFVSANYYYADVYFTIPETIYVTGEQVSLKGFLYMTNYSNNGSIVTNYSLIANAVINLTLKYANGSMFSNYSLTTDANGSFYSRSNYYSSATQIISPNISGNYYLRAEYLDNNNTRWFSQIEISSINNTLDLLRVSSARAFYFPSEQIKIEAEAIRLIGDKIIYVSNVTINGSMQNSTKGKLQAFNCTTLDNGKCSVYITAPSTYGNYFLELNNFKVFNSFSVIPFSYGLYMKDNVGKTLKNIYALGEQGRVEVKISNASTSDVYTFSGYIADSKGNNVKLISTTTLDNNNSFTNSFLFTLDAVTFSYGAYMVSVNVTKIGDGSINSITSFQVQDWSMSINKKSVGSGFEYSHSIFPNKLMLFEAYPIYRANGTTISTINTTSFNIQLKDSLNNVLNTTNATWNSTCGTSGCYDFSLASPNLTGQYILSATLSYNGATQTESRIINVINGVLTAQSTDKDGNLKELFGTNEYVYLSLVAYNQTNPNFTIGDAEIFIIRYMNGSEITYFNASRFELVNASNFNSSNQSYEWAWNSTQQKIKLDVPKTGGVYSVFVFANNQSLGAYAKFIVNPYDSCIVPKDTAGTVSSGYYYVWQFKTADTVYFEIKLTQANNPLGKATAINQSANSSYGMGAQCNIDTQTKQTVSNATLSVSEVRNMESGSLQNINATASTCQASDSSGGYTCTVKPASKWEGGVNNVKFNVAGQDGTIASVYGRFEARAFYMYGWSNTWQNSPNSNITLNVYLYEAGRGWWGSYGSGGIGGTVSVKKVEYQGRDGEWLSTPVDSGYNVSTLNSTSITTGSGSINLPVSNLISGQWKTGYYRVVLQATTTNGDTDYGYAWFGVKLWDVYGSPIECNNVGCNYKSYFNSRDNVSLFIKISRAGNYNYDDMGGADIWGNVSVKIKKIEDCRKWPCKELNSSQYNATTINVNASSPWYWRTNISSSRNYIIWINTTSLTSTGGGSWGTGYYSVVLDVNGTDTGYAWFNTIAFYIDTQPTNASGTYKYNVRGNTPMFFNITAVSSYKNGYWFYNSSGNYIYSRYNQSDYVNVSFVDMSLRTWDQTTWQSKEYIYPEDLNMSPNSFLGSSIINVTYLNGSWPSGWYWGEITFNNSGGEQSNGWLWFNVQPFRVSLSSSNYNIDSEQCINATLNVYEPDWWANTLLNGSYSVTGIYEDVWSYNSRNRNSYTNYTNSSFNTTLTLQICPNVTWSSGSWGGYHYLNVIVTDNANGQNQTGWLSFRTLAFQVAWGSIQGGTNKLLTDNLVAPVTLTTYTTGQPTIGNLTKLYQWRYDNFRSTKEEYVFKVGNCYSNASGSGGCLVNSSTVNGSAVAQNITIYAPSGGWRLGYNYLQAVWTKSNDASSIIEDWSGLYFEGRQVYNGWFDNYIASYWYKYDFVRNENVTIRLIIKNSSYDNVDVNITSVSYAYSGSGCWDESCKSYTAATFSPTNTSNGTVYLVLQYPSGNWTLGEYAVKAVVSGSGGTATITGGRFRAKDNTPPTLTLTAPVNNRTYNSTISLSATTNEDARCYATIVNYDSFLSWYCDSTNATSNLSEACNTSIYNFTGQGGRYVYAWMDSSYYSVYTNDSYSWCSSWSGTQGCTYMTTGGRSHSYTYNLSNWTASSTNYFDQYYGLRLWCYDSDYNSAEARRVFMINKTQAA